MRFFPKEAIMWILKNIQGLNIPDRVQLRSKNGQKGGQEVGQTGYMYNTDLSLQSIYQ